MQPLIKADPTSVGTRPDWMPDPGVYAYVKAMLAEFGEHKHDFVEDWVDHIPEHWIPLGIVGTLDWVVIAGWWIYENTGIFKTDEPYQWVFDYDGYEFDPDQLLVYRDSPERNKYAERIKELNIKGLERSEGVQFLAQDVYARWQGADVPEELAQHYIPPDWFIEMVMYCTFMWILSDYGREWIYMQDQVFSCVYDYSVAYVCRWDQVLLDPDIMKCTKREKNTCRFCGEGLWCVKGARLGADYRWYFMCVNCLNDQVKNKGEEGDWKDLRLIRPKCPVWTNEAGVPGTCTSTECPHNPLTEERVWEVLHEKGTERVEQYREYVRQMGGLTPRQLSGQTVEDIIEYFTAEHRVAEEDAVALLSQMQSAEEFLEVLGKDFEELTDEEKLIWYTLDQAEHGN